MENVPGYKPTIFDEIWKGRTDADRGYYHQIVQPLDLHHIKEAQGVALLGYSVDLGVARNLGRVGAQDAPLDIRKQLAKLAWHHTTPFFDAGDLHALDDDLEATQEWIRQLISSLLQNGYFPIVLGGGHDLAWPHFRALAAGHTSGSLGIINLDAHLDLRQPSHGGHSGTPFFQILSESPETGYLPIGIQKAANHSGLLEQANRMGVHPLFREDLAHSDLVLSALQRFIKAHDHLYLTIDMDGFSSAYAPGVSAPSPMGFHPDQIYPILDLIKSSKKLKSMDLVETNPSLDVDHSTSRLAARLVDLLMS